mmetsp:Transcript_28898/g.52865  ORF Transcript_28898/g.52865 Transcript_28898/m.52865 type:complete len:205 (+) Transcript_28898:932-1546(+)
MRPPRESNRVLLVRKRGRILLEGNDVQSRGPHVLVGIAGCPPSEVDAVEAGVGTGLQYVFGVEYDGGGAAGPVSLGDLGEEEVDGVRGEFDGCEFEDEGALGGWVAFLEEYCHGDVVWSLPESLHHRNLTQSPNPTLHLPFHILPPILPPRPHLNLTHQIPNRPLPRSLAPLQQIPPRLQFRNSPFPRSFATHERFDASLEGVY